MGGLQLQRLSTGSKINSARDDAAGLQISNRLTSQINGTGVAMKNANDGISMAQTAEGALEQSTTILQRMRDLALQSANGSNSPAERTALNSEVTELKKELDRIANTTSFGSKKLLDGSFGSSTFQVGAAANETITVKVSEMSTASLEGKIHTASFKFADIGLVGDASTELKLNSWNSGRAYVPPIGVPGDVAYKPPIGNPGDVAYKPPVGNFGDPDYEPAIGNPGDVAYVPPIGNPGDVAYVPPITEIKASGSYKVDLNVKLMIDGDEFPFSLGDQPELMASYQTTGGTSTPPDLIIGDLLPSLQIGLINKLAEIFANPADIMTEMSTNINDLNKGVGAFVEKDGDDTLLTFISDGTKDAPQIDIGNQPLTITTIVEKIAQLDLTEVKSSQKAIIAIDQAIQGIDAQRADLGAIQNRFENTIANLQNIQENVSAARGRIQDTDFAAETATLSKNQIMQQAGTAILAQANLLPQSVLSLLN